VIADRDPLVARALEALVPPPDGDPEELLVHARAAAVRLRAARRRRRVIAAAAFAVLVLLAGAAVAADRLDLLPFLHSGDRNVASYSIDRSRVYRGAAPAALDCPQADATEFLCIPATKAGARTYEFASRVPAQPELTRSGMLTQLATAERSGVSPALVRRIRADLGHVSDEFIRALNTLTSIESVSTGTSAPAPGLELVPPAGVPAWVDCRQVAAEAFRCRDLAASANVAVDTPIYRLQPSKDWHTVRRPGSQPNDFGRLVEAVLRRPPTAAETRFLVDFLTVAVRASGSTGTRTVPKPVRTGP
jgi:hypothetical protein